MEADRQAYSPFRESSSVALQSSTDLEGLKMVTMVRRPAAQEHSVAHVQLASRISAVMKFGVGADDDSAASSRSGGPVSVSITETDFVPESHNARRSNWGGSFDKFTDDNKTFYHDADAVNSVWQHKQISLDKNTFQIELQCMYAQTINISSPVQEETIEREDPSRASVQWYRQARFGG